MRQIVYCVLLSVIFAPLGCERKRSPRFSSEPSRDSLAGVVEKFTATGLSTRQRELVLITLLSEHCVAGRSLEEFWGKKAVLKAIDFSSFQNVTDASKLPNAIRRDEVDVVFSVHVKVPMETAPVIYVGVRGDVSIADLQSQQNLAKASVVSVAVWGTKGEIFPGN